MKNVAIIPARSGSKRIVGKNTKSFCNRPMISWVIDALREFDIFDDVIVSTDSKEILIFAEILAPQFVEQDPSRFRMTSPVCWM